MKRLDVMYPGDEVRITEGRHKGKIGVIVSIENHPNGSFEKICDVKFYHSKRTTLQSRYSMYRNSVSIKEYNITTKLNISSLELVVEPSDIEETHKTGVRLLLITGEDKI
jgi:ribosomal protein L24